MNNSLPDFTPVHDVQYTRQLPVLIDLLDGLDWWADGGFLLGTMRSHDFTPWDPDLDITIRHDDYDRFVRRCRERGISDQNEFTDGEEFLFIDDLSYRYQFGKFICHDALCTCKGWIRSGEPWIGGLNIDIFPHDNLPDDPLERVGFVRECCQIQDKLNILWKTDREEYREEALRFDELRRRYNHINTRYIGNLGIGGRDVYGKWTKFSEDFDGYLTEKFKEMDVRVPIGWRRQLFYQYGFNWREPNYYNKADGTIASVKYTWKDTAERPDYFLSLETPIIIE